MKKKLIIILAVIFIVGCSSVSRFNFFNKGSKSGVTYNIPDIYKGTDSLDIEFIDNMPPDEVYQNSGFRLGMLIKNEGASDIRTGYLALSIEKDYLEINDWQLRDIEGNKLERDVVEFNLKGKSYENPEGGLGYVTAMLQSKPIPKEQPKEHTSTMVLTACYPYQTVLSETVCVDTDIFNVRNTIKPCEVEDISSSGQGGPIAITNIKVNILPDPNPSLVKPEFIIEIENKGDGQPLIFNLQTIRNACSSASLKRSQLNKVTVFARLSNKNLKCEPSYNEKDPNEIIGFLDLDADDNKVRCFLDEGIDIEKGSFTTPLTIQLNYGYMFSVSKDITIKRLI